MLSGAVAAAPEVPSVLVVTTRTAQSGVLTARVNAAAHAIRPTHALTLPSALAALATGGFDCVLAHLGPLDIGGLEVVHALRRRAGTAVFVAVVDDDTPASADLDELTARTDVVLRERELAGGWLIPVHRSLENVRLRSALHDAESSLAQLSGIVDSLVDAVLTVDLDGKVTSWNGGAERIYGYTAPEIVGSTVAVLHPPASDEPRRIRAMIEAGESVRGLETVRRTRDGRIAEVSVDVTALRDRRGHLEGMVVVARDITDRRELEAELVRRTMHDALTGLPNRAYLTYRLSQALAEGRSADRMVAVLFVDLDQFKAVDDVYGHVTGDQVLARMADRLRELVRPTDLVSRVGGDKFVIVCPDTGVEAAGRMADRVLEAVAEPIAVERRALRIGASVGIAVSPPLEGDAESLLKHADAAMHEAKARGRARAQLFDPALTRRAGERRLLASDLRDAVAQDLVEVHYQPVVNLATEEIVGLEALARWHHPTRGAVSPGTFVPLAEAHGFAAELDRRILERACHETVAAMVARRLPPTLRVAVNLSARSLDDPGIVAMVEDVLRRSGLSPDSLVLEITETALLQNRDTARAALDGLRGLGAGVSLDDFGTGYSSLSFLRELPVTGVKIDRSFVRDAVDRPEDLAITEAIVRLADGLGLETVAEGVETVEQRELLRRLGCSTAQGFLWSAAVPMAELTGEAVASARPERPTGPRRWNPLARRVVEPPARTRTACCLRGGLEAGQAWLVVTTAERHAAFARELGPLRATALGHGRLVELDAYDTLRRITAADGGLDALRFEHVIGAALRRLGTGGDEVGVHAELGHVTQPLLSNRVSTDLRRRLDTVAPLTLAYGDRPADCATHGPLPTAVRTIRVDGSAS